MTNKDLKGLFVPTYIPYQGRSARDQAIEVLELVSRHHDKHQQAVGITYSANHGQSVSIREAYQNKHWITHTNGGNQATVIAEIEHALQTPSHQRLQSHFRILPITTCTFSGGSGHVEDAWIDEDLAAIRAFLLPPNHGIVLGWQNENTVHQGTYAIGGGISQQLTKQQNELIQSTLKMLEQQFQA